MTKQDFLNEFTEALELDEGDIDFSTPLSEVENYDSFAIISVIALIHKNFGVQLSGDDLQNIVSVNSLIEKIGAEKFNG